MKRSTILLACTVLLTASCSKQEKVKAQSPVDDKPAATLSPAKADSQPLSQAPVVVKPAEEHEKEKMAEAVGLYPVQVDAKYGFIDKTGKVVITPQFGAALAFSNGLAPAMDLKTGKWGYIDKSAKFVVPAKFDIAYPFAEDLGVVRLAGNYGAVDRSGNLAVPAIFAGMSQFTDGVAAALINQAVGGGMVATAWGFVDKEGKYLIQPRFESVTPFGEGLIGVRKLGGAWGYVDIKNQQVITPQFQEVGPFSQGLASAKDKHLRWGFIDKSGKYIIAPQFIAANAFSEGLAAVYLNNKWGFIDKAGKFVIPPKFDGATQFNDGLALVKIGEKESYVDRAGKTVWTAKS
ncbi:MAG: WG repeat-containing protein [Bryobacteraceae bacterium]